MYQYSKRQLFALVAVAFTAGTSRADFSLKDIDFDDLEKEVKNWEDKIDD